MKKILIGLSILTSMTVFAANSGEIRVDSFVNMKSNLDVSLQRGEITVEEYSELMGDILDLVLVHNGEYGADIRAEVNTADLNRLQDTFRSMLDSNQLSQAEYEELENDIKDLRSIIK